MDVEDQIPPMLEEKIEVIAYSGYRGEETPRTILFRGERIEIVEILKRWMDESSEDRSRRRFFEIKGSDRAVRLIYYDEKVMEWFHILKDCLSDTDRKGPELCRKCKKNIQAHIPQP
jgi:hypothetical protein